MGGQWIRFFQTAPDKKRILFTGDNLYPTSHERWDGFALSKDNIPEMINSLKKIQKLNVDVVVPAGHSVKNLFYKEVDKEVWKEMCWGAISRFEEKL